MCAICGIIAFGQQTQPATAEARVRAMVATLAHRGPDDAGQIAAGGATLGATRLAIRALHDGKQPIVDRKSGVVMVCNGEIDNHRSLRAWLAERGRNVTQAVDVAVIPALYLELGDAFVERLVGVFALALWDPRTERLLLARDRTGERPLFYAIQNGVVSFATEISALAQDSGFRFTFSREGLAGYLERGCFIAPESPVAEIHKVAPAELLSIEADRIEHRCYWRWNIAKTPKRAPSLEAFDEVFREAVRRQSDVDVPYCVFLSGGIDSSLVAAVTRSIHPEKRLKAYTIRFQEQSYDEGLFAEQVARRLNMDPVSVLIRPDDLPGEITKLVEQIGEPLADQSWIPSTLLARAARREVKLGLVGEGADELFGGYPTYIGAQVGQRYARLPRPVRAVIKTLVEKWPPSDKKVTLSFLLKRFVQGAELDGVTRHLLWTASISPPLLERLGVKQPEPRAVDRSAGALLDLVQQIDLETSLAEGLLTEKDRASMSSALELRSPYLDQAVMEFAATLPVTERVRGVTTKVFLKRYALRYLPKLVVHRKKRGLSVPFSTWLRGPLYEWSKSMLDAEWLAPTGVDNRAALELLDEHCLRRADHARTLWTLIVLSVWARWASQPRNDATKQRLINPA